MTILIYALLSHAICICTGNQTTSFLSQDEPIQATKQRATACTEPGSQIRARLEHASNQTDSSCPDLGVESLKLYLALRSYLANYILL
uniref:Secreted protein n=1 Tax=Arundo donax TaxID=35708 RepID=A0A0A9AY49_ARUDO